MTIAQTSTVDAAPFAELDALTIGTVAVPGDRKYDATAGSMIGLLKYGSGLPFNRLDGLQGDLGVPLPASTQWDIVQAVAANLAPAFDELIRQAAQGEVLHNDDTTVKILELMGERARQEALAGALGDGDADQRRGLYTSGVVALRDDGSFTLDQRYFDYLAGLTMTSPAFHELFGGPPRVPESPLAQRHMDLARDLGAEGIRVNLVSAGPLKTLAAKAIPGFEDLEELWSTRAPLGWDNTDHAPTAKAVCALLSDFFPATTGEIVHVDGGFHAMGA